MRSAKDVKGLVGEVKEPGKDIAEGLKDIGTEVYGAVKSEKQVKDLGVLASQVVTDLGVALGKELAKIQPALDGAARTAFRTTASADRLAGALQRASYPRAAEILSIGLESSLKTCITHTDGETIGKELGVKFKASLDVAALKNLLLASDASPRRMQRTLFDKAGEAALGELAEVQDFAGVRHPARQGRGRRARDRRGGRAGAARRGSRRRGGLRRTELEELDKAARRATRNKITKGEGGDASVKSIAKLIQVMQTKRIILMSAAKVAQGGFDVAAKFFSPLEIAGSSLKFIQCLITAANQAMELNRWLKNAKKAQRGESIYGPTIDNFINNREIQLTHATIKAALQLVKLAGGIVAAFGGIAAPAGEALAKAAAIAEASEELIYQSVEKGRVIRAWSVTREALLNPNNRKLGKRARNLNHTLAKFALAYGAVVQKEPHRHLGLRIVWHQRGVIGPQGYQRPERAEVLRDLLPRRQEGLSGSVAHRRLAAEDHSPDRGLPVRRSAARRGGGAAEAGSGERRVQHDPGRTDEERKAAPRLSRRSRRASPTRRRRRRT